MDALVYTAASGASRVMKAQMVRADNLGNADTVGFRSQMERAEAFTIKGAGFKGRTLVNTLPSGIDLTPAALDKTGRKLDLAIQGEGLFAVQHHNGSEAYTRSGSFKIDQESRLHLNGLSVLDANGGAITIPAYRSIEISQTGLISIVPNGGNIVEVVGQLKLVNPPSVELKKDDYGLIISSTGEPFEPDLGVSVASGYIEESNVSPVTELVDVMSLTRNFEMQLKMMKAAEDIAKAGNRLMSER